MICGFKCSPCRAVVLFRFVSLIPHQSTILRTEYHTKDKQCVYVCLNSHFIYYQICRYLTWRRRGCSVDVIWWLSLRSVTCVYIYAMLTPGTTRGRLIRGLEETRSKPERSAKPRINPRFRNSLQLRKVRD